MSNNQRPVTADTPGAEGAPGVGRREVLRLAAVAPGVALIGVPEGVAERVVISPGGWILLESDLR